MKNLAKFASRFEDDKDDQLDTFLKEQQELDRQSQQNIELKDIEEEGDRRMAEAFALDDWGYLDFMNDVYNKGDLDRIY